MFKNPERASRASFQKTSAPSEISTAYKMAETKHPLHYFVLKDGRSSVKSLSKKRCTSRSKSYKLILKL